MGRAKEIELRVIPSSIANQFVRQHHYSGKVVNNSTLHFGAFLDGALHGVMSYGPSMFKGKAMKLVAGTKWHEFIELNRMAFDDFLPRNSESFCIGLSLRLIRKNCPQIKWIISFADGTQCGDGTIYRAANFVLTGITANTTIIEFPDGSRLTRLTIDTNPNHHVLQKFSADLGIPHKQRRTDGWLSLGARIVPGYMMRYIYFIDKSYRSRLTVPEIPYSRIKEMGASMYLGVAAENSL